MRLGVEAAAVDGRIVPGDVEIADGEIAAVGLASPNGRGVAVPGFVDLQVNGFGGVDFLEADGDGYSRAGDALLETGVTAYLAAFITAPEDQLIDALRQVPEDGGGPRVLGVHLEGPFLAEGRLGTHPRSARRDPDPALLDRLLDGGRVRLMTLAPELPGALELVDVLQARGVTVSFGHTNASAEEATRGFELGVRTVTHLFNAMRPFNHRDPGIAGAALSHPDVVVQIILDGVHLAPETARIVWSAAGGRVALVTDAIAGAGSREGAYTLGDVSVEVRDGIVRREDGVLAGSVVTMIEAVRNLHDLGVPLANAVAAASSVPARVLGLENIGRLAAGRPADVVVLDDNLEIQRVLVRGEARVAA